MQQPKDMPDDVILRMEAAGVALVHGAKALQAYEAEQARKRVRGIKRPVDKLRDAMQAVFEIIRGMGADL